jgi:uncharacterized protein (TIGR03067 family)
MRQRIAQLVTVLAVATLGCGSPGPGVGATVDEKVKAEELALLAGTWVYERQVVEGREIPIAEMSKSNIVIRGNLLTRDVYRADGKQLIPVKSTIWIDPTINPKQIDDDAAMPIGTSRRPGIYQLDGDRLTLCYDNTGGTRPTKFESPSGSSLVLSVLRRQGK